jgi:hypothetical protein
MEAKITNLRIKLPNSQIDLTLEEAQSVYDVLSKIFNKEVLTIPQPYPVYPNNPYPWYPTVTYKWSDGVVTTGSSNFEPLVRGDKLDTK